MARLTRTQKYAELRDQLANDREVSKTTDQLSEFENKLNHIENVLTPKKPETETAAFAVEEKLNNIEEPVETIEQTVSIESLKDVFAPVSQTAEEENDIEETSVFSGIDYEIHVVENPGVDSEYTEPETVEETVAEEVTVTEEPVTVEEVTAVETPAVEETVTEVLPVEEPVEVENVIDNTVVVETPVVEEPVTVEETPVEEKYSWEEFESDFTADLDKIISDWKFDDIFKGSLEETAETPVVEQTSAVEETPVEVAETPVEETVVEEPVTVEETPVETPVSFADPFGDETVKEVVETVEEPVETAEVEEIEIIEETPVTEEVAVAEVETPVEEPVTVEEPVKEETSYTDFFEVDDEDVTSTFESLFEETPVNLMDETKAEVDEYNSNSGEKNLMEIADTLVEEVRHPETEELDADEVIETPVTNTQDDEEFSNTVSMEISKIMDEIKTQEETNPLAEQIEEPVVEKEPEFEHPVLTQALEEPEEDIVEIKNLKEIDIEPVKDATISSTIPFIVTNDDDEEYDEDDEEGSNTILNIILIILIIILVAVLGLIVFYILKTKGII